MDNILNELSSIFRLVSSVPVTGDAIDTIAVARAKLKAVYRDIESMNKEVPPNEGIELQG